MTTRFRHGAGRLCLDLLRTLRHRGTPGEVEELPDAEALAAWVDELGPRLHQVGHAPDPTPAEAQRLREAIHRLVTGARPDPADRETINRAAARPTPVPRLDPAGERHWVADNAVAATLAMAASDAIDLVSSGALAKVRGCANPECGALFYDDSRPGTRRWCNMNTCGNRAKKSALRTRRS